MLDFSILYDDGVVKKQAGSTRTAAAPVTTSGGHHKIETNMLRPTLGSLLKIVIGGREF